MKKMQTNKPLMIKDCCNGDIVTNYTQCMMGLLQRTSCLKYTQNVKGRFHQTSTVVEMERY